MNSWGTSYPEEIAEKLGRTVGACRSKAYSLLGTKSMNRGGYSVRSLSKETGYHYTQIRGAILALGLEDSIKRKGGSCHEALRRWGKGWDNRTWLITDNVAEAILKYLGEDTEVSAGYALCFLPKGCKLDRWSRAHDCCVECGTTEKKHWGKGKCSICAKKPYLERMRRNTRERKRRMARWWDQKRKLQNCVDCGTDRRPHHAKGLCDSCYQNKMDRRAA